MCVIVDANCFSRVFDPTNKEHNQFISLHKWIFSGYGGNIIFGGDKYLKEIKIEGGKYLGLLAELKRKGRIKRVSDEDVNRIAGELKTQVIHRDFDDEHIIAIVIVSKCCVVCTDDARSIPFLKRRKFYPKGTKPPKIYKSDQNSSLCCAKHVAEICK